MEVILSKQCLALSGCLGRGFGYFIVNRKGRFYSQRSKHSVPPDGHWRFILMCADMAYHKQFLDDIKVYPDDLGPALYNAHHFIAYRNIKDRIYNARDILNLKTTFSL